MKIIDSSTLEIIGPLSGQDMDYLGFSYLGSKYNFKANVVLENLRNSNAFLQCECVKDSKFPPLLGVRKLSSGAYILANLPGRSDHAENCPFGYDKTKNLPKNKKQDYKPIVQSRDNGYLEIDENGIKSLYRKLIHNSQLNSVNPNSWDIKTFQTDLINGARLSPELIQLGISKKIQFGFQSLIRAKDELNELEHGDYQVCFNLISEFDNRAINLSFKDESPYWQNAGKIVTNTVTSKGPYIATTILSRFKDSIIVLGSFIEPVLSKWMPIPISSHMHRELAFKIVGKGGLFDKPIFSSPKFKLIIPMFPVSSPISDTEIHPDLIVDGINRSVVIGCPIKEQKYAYNELGSLVWFRELPLNKEKRKWGLEKLIGQIEGLI
jgi:hypothetical protein